MDCAGFRDDMLDVLYGEADAQASARFEAHRASCESCRDELGSLEGVRHDLQAWGIDKAMGAPRRSRFLVPWRGLAAAAAVVLSFGAGLGASRLEVRDGEIAFRLPASGPPAGDSAAPRPAELEARLARHEAEYRSEIQLVKAELAAPRSTGVDPALLRQVRDMIRESEARQAVLFQTGLTDLWRTAEAQRRQDLARISAGFSYLEGKAAVDVARTNELMSKALRVSLDEGEEGSPWCFRLSLLARPS
jgi:hypothetical protein